MECAALFQGQDPVSGLGEDHREERAESVVKWGGDCPKAWHENDHDESHRAAFPSRK
jgi:hypothetical protein